MADHSTLPEAELHENKGVSTATDYTVATALGGATVWQKIKVNNLNTTSEFFTTNKVYLTGVIDDVSTAGTIYFYMPFAGTVNQIKTVLGNAITVADAVVTAKNNTGASMGTITVAFSGSASKDVDTLNPGSNNTFIAGDVLSVETDGASTTTSKLYVMLILTVTG